jgi:hypothetical protein
MNSSEIEAVVSGTDEEKIEKLLDKLIDKVRGAGETFLENCLFFQAKTFSIFSGKSLVIHSTYQVSRLLANGRSCGTISWRR